MCEETKNYRVFVTVYHSFSVEAASEENAREIAKEVIWDDHIDSFKINVAENEDE